MTTKRPRVRRHHAVASRDHRLTIEEAAQLTPDELVAAHAWLIRGVARTLRGKHAWLTQLDIDDMVADGNIGLIRASRRWNPARGVDFWQYAGARIAGEMMDGGRNIVGRTDNSIHRHTFPVGDITALSHITPHSIDPVEGEAIVNVGFFDALHAMNPRQRGLTINLLTWRGTHRELAARLDCEESAFVHRRQTLIRKIRAQLRVVEPAA